MRHFHGLSIAACNSALNHDFGASLSYAKESLGLFPNNFVLISQLINEFSKSDEGRARLLEFDELITDSLKSIGRSKSVFGFQNSISFLRLKILNALNANSLENPKTELLHSCRGPSHLPPKGISRDAAPFRMGILSCIWERPGLTRIFLNHLYNLAKQIKNEIHLIPIIVGSDRVADGKVCSEFKFQYSCFPNSPLSQKWEHGLSVASDMNLDALIILGSDDFVDKNLLFAYKRLIRGGVNLAGLPKAYFLDLDSPDARLILWSGYGSSAKCLGQPHRLGETIGMARILSKSLLEKLDYSLWPGLELNKGLDFHSLRRMLSFGHLPVSYRHYVNSRLFDSPNALGQVCIDLDDIDAFAIDIKHGGNNVTSFDKYIACSCTHRFINSPWKLLSNRLGDETVDRLRLLASQSDDF